MACQAPLSWCCPDYVQDPGKEGKIQQEKKGSQGAHGLSPGTKAVMGGKQEAVLPMPREHAKGSNEAGAEAVQASETPSHAGNLAGLSEQRKQRLCSSSDH